MSKNNIIRLGPREPTHAELNSLTEQRDRLVIEAMCRALGRTDFSLAEMYPRGKWVQYADGDMVFSFDGMERFIIGPVTYHRETDKYVQQVEQLWDKTDYVHTPLEEIFPQDNNDEEE